MAFKAFLAHPLTVAVLGSVGGPAIIAGFATIKDYRLLNETLTSPVLIPLWGLAGIVGTGVTLLATLWVIKRRGKQKPDHDKDYVPSDAAEHVVAAIRALDDVVDDDYLVNRMLPLVPADMGRRDLQLAIKQLYQAGWLQLEPFPGGYGYALTTRALVFCRDRNLLPTKDPAQRPSRSLPPRL